MNQNKTSRYLKYAIGEIILVVIGILIALQINTWKENNKIRALEIETLSEIKEALVQDTLVIYNNLSLLETKLDEGEFILNHIEQKKEHIPELDTLMMRVYYHKGYNTFNTAAFELLKDRGFGIIKNARLRKQITNHYTTDIADTRSILARLDRINLIQGERMYENFKISDGLIYAYNYEDLLNDPKLIGPFSHFQTMNQGYMNRLKEFNDRIKKVLWVIIEELESRGYK